MVGFDTSLRNIMKLGPKRVDTRIVDHRAKTVTTLEMSCPWIQNREKKDEEKVLKYQWSPTLGAYATVQRVQDHTI